MCESKIESPKDSQIPETLDSVKTNEDICTIKGDENENKSQEKPNLSVEKISTKDSQVTFNEIDLQENQMIPSEISKEDSLISNVVLKTSTACPSEGSLQSEILASTKDTIPQEASNPLGVKEKENIKGGLISDGVFNWGQSSKKPHYSQLLKFS